MTSPSVNLPSILDSVIGDGGENPGEVAISIIASPGAQPQTTWRDVGSPEPTFLIYSITKLYIASMVLRLSEQGRVDLDSSIARWFPRVESSPHITIRQLLDHTAGIRDYGGLDAYHAAVRESASTPWSPERYIVETVGRGPLFEPGTGWSYSNVGFMLVRLIIEDIVHGSFGEAVEQMVSRPLGLERTFVPRSVADLRVLTAGMSSLVSEDGSMQDVRGRYHPDWVSHGVIAATASDVARFVDALFQGGFLSKNSIEQMLQFVPVFTDEELAAGRRGSLRALKPSYGLGVMGDPESPWGLTAGHTGGGPAYAASAFHSFGLGGVTVSVASAIEDMDTQAIIAALFDAAGELKLE